MSEPIYNAGMERLWKRIPAGIRREDAAQDFAFKKFISGAGTQLGEINDLIERFTLIAPNDRVGPSAKPMPIGDVWTHTDAADPEIYPNDAGIWSRVIVPGYDGVDVGTYTVGYELLHQTDQAYVEETMYLPGGTYEFAFKYRRKSVNGIWTLLVNGERLTRQALDATANDNAVRQTQPVTFEVTRGYANVRVLFEMGIQANNTKLINVGPMRAINVRGGYPYETSDLVNPASADPAWLEWLALFVGVKLDKSLGISDQREAITFADSGYKAGTKASLAASVRPLLSGTKFVRVFDHSTEANVGTANWYDVLIVTRSTETPSGVDVPEWTAGRGAKPAGIKLHHATFSASWDAITAALPTWNDWQGKTWAEIEEIGFL